MPEPSITKTLQIMEFNMEEIILKMAKAIQAIEHNGWHDWYSCHEVARERALKQAKACFDILEDLH